mgnify:FL=1
MRGSIEPVNVCIHVPLVIADRLACHEAVGDVRRPPPNVSVLHQGTDANFVCFFSGHVAPSLSAIIMPGEVGVVKL